MGEMNQGIFLTMEDLIDCGVTEHYVNIVSEYADNPSIGISSPACLSIVPACSLIMRKLFPFMGSIEYTGALLVKLIIVHVSSIAHPCGLSNSAFLKKISICAFFC
jgi:hypothetical protein